jgi:bifunctional pyridoxal-dependent enzyme with beta-cystathionase and maltose regulon repressor activities
MVEVDECATATATPSVDATRSSGRYCCWIDVRSKAIVSSEPDQPKTRSVSGIDGKR